MRLLQGQQGTAVRHAAVQDATHAVPHSNKPAGAAQPQQTFPHSQQQSTADDPDRQSSQARELQEARQQIALLHAEKERLMEVGNELRAQQHRIELQAQQQTPVSSGVSPLWQLLPGLNMNLQSQQSHSRPLNAVPLQSQPQQAQQVPNPSQAAAVPRTPALPAVSDSQTTPASPPSSGLQPFHPDYGQQDAKLAAVTGTRPSFQLDEQQGCPRETEHLMGAKAEQRWHALSSSKPTDVDAEEVAERLRRIEVLTERIARAQLASSASSRPPARVPAKPKTVTLSLNALGQDSLSPRASMVQPDIPVRMSARATPSQTAKLQVLQQRQARVPRARARNWNHQDQ